MTSPKEPITALARRIEDFLREQPRYFVDVVMLTDEGRYRDVLRAWGLVRERGQLQRDEQGRYLLPATPGKGQPQ